MLIVVYFLEAKMVSLHNGELYQDTFSMANGFRMPL